MATRLVRPRIAACNVLQDRPQRLVRMLDAAEAGEAWWWIRDKARHDHGAAAIVLAAFPATYAAQAVEMLNAALPQDHPRDLRISMSPAGSHGRGGSDEQTLAFLRWALRDPVVCELLDRKGALLGFCTEPESSALRRILA